MTVIQVVEWSVQWYRGHWFEASKGVKETKKQSIKK